MKHGVLYPLNQTQSLTSKAGFLSKLCKSFDFFRKNASKSLLIAFMTAGFLLCSLFTFATKYYSQGSLAANSTSSWNTVRAGGGTAPANFTTSSDTFYIQNGHLMTTSAAWSVTGTNSKIQIENGGQLTCTFLVGVPNFQVDNGGTFVFNYASATANGVATDFPGSTSKVFGASSTVEIQKWGSGTGTSPVALPTIASPGWGNLIINVATEAGSWQQSGAITAIQGDFTITSTGGGSYEFRLSSSTNYTLTIGGNLNLNGGTLSTSSSGITTGALALNISGNLNFNGGILGGSSSASVRTITVTGSVNMTSSSSSIATNAGTTFTIGNGINISAGTFSLGTSSAHVTTVNVTGNISLSGTGSMAGTSSSTNNVTCSGNFTMTGTSTYAMQGSTTARQYSLSIGGNMSIGAGCTFTGGSTGSAGTLNFTGGSSSSVSYTNNGTLTTSKPLIWTIASGKTLLLNSDLVIYTSTTVGSVTVNGTLDCSTNKVTGSGDFTLGSTGKLIIGDAAGITAAVATATGSIQTTTSRTFPTTATYEYKGSTAQSTGSGLPGTVNNLIINNSAGVTLTNTDTVSNVLTLTSGKLSLGNNNLVLSGNSSSISGPAAFGSTSSNYIVTNGTGSLSFLNIGSGARTGTILFPVGASSSLYNPVTIQNAGTSDKFSVRAVSGSPAGLSSSIAVNNSWIITEGTTGGSNATFGFQWAAAQENASFDRNNCAVAATNGTSIQATSVYGLAGGSNPYTSTLSAISTLYNYYGINSIVAPTVGSTAMSSVGITTARATSSVTSDGGSTLTDRGFVVGYNTDPTTDDQTFSEGTLTTGAMTVLIENLTPNTTYYIRSYATNERGTSYGANQTFTTYDYPVIATTSVSSITATSAVSGGNISSDGGATITERGVVYGTAASPTTANTKVIDASTGTGTFTSTLNGLNPATAYYLRAYATNSTGTYYGDEKSFTTLANAPTVTTTAISSITGVSASSGGNVTADGGASVTERGIVYSTSANPTTSNTKIINGSTGTGSYSSSITGLANNTTYYVRAYAINSVGTSYGSQVSFTTLNKPTVTTTAASLITTSTAATGGNVTSNGGDAITERGVVISTSPNPTTSDTKFADASIGTGSFTTSLTGLSASTIYHIRAYAVNNTGTSYGSDLTFTTSSNAIAPTVTTSSVSNLGSSTVTVGGSVDSDGGDVLTERGVVYGSSSNPTTSDTKVVNGSTTTGSFTADLNGLTPGSTYHIRAYAINSVGTSYGSDVSFTMNAVLPTVTTTAASNVAQTTATSGGNVTYNGGASITERGIVYGTSVNPTTSNTKIIDGSTGTGTFVSNLTGLVGTVTYHVRAYATNSVGTAYGTDESFTTLASAPVVTTSAISAITGASANGGGNVTSDGGDPVTERGLVISTSSNPTISDTKITASGTTGSFSSSLNGLSPLTTYHVRAFATNGIGTSYGSDISFTTLSAMPITQASSVNFTSVTLNGMTINFTAGSGANSIVLVKSGSAVNSDPISATTYTANSVLGSGSQIGTGNYVVYIGTGNSISITGLTPGTTYHVAVYSFNGSSGSENYLTTTPAMGNQATLNTEYRSIVSGNWTSTTTWEKYNGSSWIAATEFPSSDKGNITIQAGHTVSLDTSISVDEMTIAATAQLNINAGKIMTVVNGTGNDLTVNGYLKCSGRDTVAPAAAMIVNGTYEHAVSGGVIPTATWANGSTCLVTGVVGTSAPTGSSQNFYNFTWNCPSQNNNVSLAFNNNTIGGNFTVQSVGTPNTSALRMTTAGTAATNNIVINGNIIVNSGLLTTQGSSSGTSTISITVGGNITIASGATLDLNNGGPSSNPTTTSSWFFNGTQFSNSGTVQCNKLPSSSIFKFNNSATFTNSGTLNSAVFQIPNGVTLDAGTSLINGTAVLRLDSSATLKSANTGGIITSTGTQSLHAKANYIFNGSAAQTMPASITAANNITVNNSAGITLGAPASVTGTLTLTNGKLTLGNNSLTLSNAISGASSSNYIVTSGTGTLKYLSVGNSSTTYPIGSSSTSYSPLTLTNAGTSNDIGVRASATFVKSLYNTAKAVGLQWNITSSSPGTVANATFNWNTGDQGASFNNTATGEIGIASGTRNYSVTSLGTLSGTSKSATGLALDSTNNYIAIGNTDAVYIPEILGFDVSTLTGGSGSFGASPYSATTLNANLSSSGLVRGSGLTTSGTASSGAWGAGGGFNSATSALGISGNKFITFTVKPNSGYSTDLLSLNPLSYRTSSSGPANILIQYQVNSGSFADLLSTTLTTNTTTGQLGPIDLSGVTALQNLQSNETVTFRLVPFGASSSTGTFYINNVNASTSSDLALIGKVNACNTYSDAPVITTPVCAGATTVSGTSSEANGTNIDLYLNGTWNQSVTVAGGTWSATTSALTAGTVLTAYATAPGECLSAVSSSVTVGTPTSSSTSTAVCSASLPYNWNGNNYSAAGTYTTHLTNAAGCDSTATLVLTVNNGTFTSSTASACDSYTWTVNGQTYTTSGIYIRNYNNTNGCPSADTLRLTITASSSNTSTINACDSYTWTVNGVTYTTSGSYSSVSGCHTEYLNLTITTSSSNTTNATVCDSYTWSANGQTYTTSGSRTYVSGCHTEILNLTVTSSTSNTSSITVCGGYTWNVTGQTYTVSGSYTSVSGCATEILNLTVNQGIVLSFSTHPSRTTQKVTLNYVVPAYFVVPAGSGTYTYQWYRNTSDSNIGGTLISGATSSSYVPSTSSASTSYYYCVITNEYGCSTPSNPSGFLTVCAP